MNTPRLILEPLSSDFCHQYYVDWMNDAEVIQYMDSGGDYTINKLKTFLQDAERNEIFFWAIIIRETNKHIGNIKIDPINRKHRFGEYGIMIGDRDAWGKGFGKEASLAVINYFFEIIKLRKINLGVIKDNIGALKLYESIGFKKEGLLRGHYLRKEQSFDVVRMAIFNTDLFSFS